MIERVLFYFLDDFVIRVWYGDFLFDFGRLELTLVLEMTRLAFLSPKIVEAIAGGYQPPELTAKALTERIELPLLWSEQERSIGID
jgi:hypothetical protein